MLEITQWQAQALLYQTLSQEPALTDLLAQNDKSIFDAVPIGAQFPYMTFGQSRTEPVDTQTYHALQVDMTFDVWSQYQGYKELKEIAAVFQSIFKRMDIENIDGRLILAKQMSSETTREKDGKTRKLQEKWRFVFEAIT